MLIGNFKPVEFQLRTSADIDWQCQTINARALWLRGLSVIRLPNNIQTGSEPTLLVNKKPPNYFEGLHLFSTLCISTQLLFPSVVILTDLHFHILLHQNIHHNLQQSFYVRVLNYKFQFHILNNDKLHLLDIGRKF